MRGKSFFFNLTGGVLLAFMLACGAGSQPSSLPSVNTNSQAPRESPAEAVPSPVMTILEAYQKDSATADRKYKDQTLLLSGTVAATGKTKKGIPFIGFQKEGASSPVGAMVVCSVDPAQAAQVAALKKGQEVKFKGQVQGELVRNLMIKECQLQ